MEYLPTRLAALHSWLHEYLGDLRHHNGSPLIQILTLSSSKSTVNQTPNGLSNESSTGYVLSCTFHSSTGARIPNSKVSKKAAEKNISLRTGCVCNPGGASALLKLKPLMEMITDGVRLHEFEKEVGEELGVIRISLGLVSNFEDVWQVVKFAETFLE